MSELQNELPDPLEVRPCFNRRWGFTLLIGLSVIVTSFAYGLAVGFSRRTPQAQAAMGVWGAAQTADYELRRIVLPSGSRLVPVGQDLALNGKTVEMAGFVSSRDVQQVLNEITSNWEAQGFLALGAASRKRGVAFAMNKQTGERFSASAWTVPPSYRRVVSQGLPVQGFIAVSAAEADGAALPDEDRGLVPDVPIVPGGRPGAVLSSKDSGGRSFTGTYTNPGGLDTNVEFYRSTLSAAGWVVAGFQTGEGSQKSGSLILQRGRKELVLLFSEMQSARDNSVETLVTVALGSQAGMR